jgi:signal peptidase I
MSPTYSNKELVWATSLQSEYQKDDVVVVKLENRLVVKRIKFVSGDVFWVLKDDKLHWTPIPDDMVEDFKNINIWKIKKLTVPNDAFWLEGDNKQTSYDSRMYGFFNKEQIVGVLCVSRFNTNNYDISASISRMQYLKQKGESVTMEKFITNVFKP